MNSRNSTTLLAFAVSLLLNRPAALPWRLQVDRSGENHHPDRGDVKAWMIITLLSAVLFGVLLAISGPPLAALLNQVLEKAG